MSLFLLYEKELPVLERNGDAHTVDEEVDHMDGEAAGDEAFAEEEEQEEETDEVKDVLYSFLLGVSFLTPSHHSWNVCL